MKKKVVVVQKSGSLRQDGTWAMVQWLKTHGYDFLLLVTNGADARAQATNLRGGPFHGVVMDADQFDSIEHAFAAFGTIANALLPHCEIVHHQGSIGQSEKEVSGAFLDLYLPKC